MRFMLLVIRPGFFFPMIFNAPTSALAQIRQSYMRHVPLCDGEKFLHIQFYERKKDYEVALRWKKLLGAKVKSLHQVLRNDWLRDCLEKLEPFRSLWMGFQLGCFPLILSWRCSQVREIEYYLNHIYEIWHTITDGNTHLCDEYTVEKLGGLAPLWSSRDRSMIETLFTTCQVFCRVRDSAVRAQILQRVLTVEGLILNFKTFFKHVKVLGPIMLPLRELFPAAELFPSRDEFSLVSRRLPSVRDILLQHCYKQHEDNKQQCLLQYSEHDERFFECSDPGRYAYWQLCLYLFRHSKSQWNSYNEGKGQKEQLERSEWIIRLGHFARKLGFASAEISSLCNQDPNLSQIRIHMLQERPNHSFSVSAEKFEAEAHSRRTGQAIFEPRLPALTPLMTTDNATTIRITRSHPELFLPTIWTALTQEPRYALTEYGMLVLICMSFFEKFGSASISSICEGFQPTQPNQLTQTAQPARPPLRSSSIYSVPVYPDYLARSHGGRITFWHLPQSRNMLPQANHVCDITEDDVKKVVNSIQTQGDAPLFALLDTGGLLKLCNPSQILHRRKGSKQPNNIYYVYGKKNSKNWISKQLNSR
ncbi:hypothetical protein COCMIDRAFT_109778 [Bipolaris oryzae ATCC 44560]|uniref:Uncharacterized protein n=1 Tax=Bipolaris oryzae ATCC 44560 TaxID=930090 RepID=W6YRB0_COCMI|nr:uncharacterized protein COCMIDRAFT_109778 [Bipolaris oryzae ATCC 44560]EUC40048.1 hypothetical protein COCMIDRAFT_109778 [Bipolaris oryzae ATCC 44560]